MYRLLEATDDLKYKAMPFPLTLLVTQIKMYSIHQINRNRYQLTLSNSSISVSLEIIYIIQLSIDQKPADCFSGIPAGLYLKSIVFVNKKASYVEIQFSSGRTVNSKPGSVTCNGICSLYSF